MAPRDWHYEPASPSGACFMEPSVSRRFGWHRATDLRAAATAARDATAYAFHMPGGELLVWLGAAGVLGYGVYQLYRAYAAKLSRQLDLTTLTGATRVWIVAISRFGIAARGVIFCLIGFFLGRAAALHDAGKAGGIRESLRMLASIGRWPFALVALGLIAYGVYELVNARYRNIHVAG